MKKRKNFKKDKKNTKNSKLSLFQKADLKFSKACPLSGKDAPIIDYKNIKLLRRYVSDTDKIMPTRITSVSQNKVEKSCNFCQNKKLLLLQKIAPIPTLESRQYCSYRRCRTHRSLLGGIGNQTCPGRCYCAC